MLEECLLDGVELSESPEDRRAARDPSYLRGLWLFLRTRVMLLKPNPHECESKELTYPLYVEVPRPACHSMQRARALQTSA